MTARRTPLDTILSSQRGSTFGRVLLIILGSILILSGLILSIATFGITLEGDASILILLPFALSSIAGGIYIIATQAHNMKAIEPTSGKARAARIEAGDGDDRIVSSVPLTETPTFPLTPTPEPSASASGETPKDDITQLVFRSSDLFATLRDLVRHEEAATTPSSKGHLASMLEAAGVMDWTDAPACEGGRLSRNGRFWVRLGGD